MSEAKSGEADPHFAIARRKTRVNAFMAHAGYKLSRHLAPAREAIQMGEHLVDMHYVRIFVVQIE
jgi:hypothetical protein